jgi:hypothetical protein
MAAPLLLLLGGRRLGEPWLGYISLQFNGLWHYRARTSLGLPVVDDILKFVALSLLLAAWCWIGGFAFGALARRLSWVHPVLIFVSSWICLAPLVYVVLHPKPEYLTYVLPVIALVTIPLLVGVARGAKVGGLSLRWNFLVAATLSALTVAVQIENPRIPYEVWAEGGAAMNGFHWNLELLPFAAIIWQFCLMTILGRPPNPSPTSALR